MTANVENVSWEERVETVLKTMEVTDSDFRRSGGAGEVHNRVLASLKAEWNKSKVPVMDERGFQIDFVGRTFPHHGRVELAVEVDTSNRPLGNWVKLLDISAATKIWVYLCREKDKAEERFNEAQKEFRVLANLRAEAKTNNVSMFMKVAGDSNVKKASLFE